MNLSVFHLAKLFLVLLSFALVALHVRAQCPDVRLDKEGGTMQSMPVLDQGRGNVNCIPYAMAQLIDAHRFATGDARRDHLTSPLVLSAQMASDKGSAIFAPSIAQDAFASLERHGSCSYAAVNDKVGAFDARGSMYELQEKFYNPAQRLSADKTAALEKIATDLSCFLSQNASTKVSVDTAQALEALAQKSFIGFMTALSSSICTGTNLIPISGVRLERESGMNAGSAEARKQKIKEAIIARIRTSRSEPVAVNVCQTFLLQSSTAGWVRGLDSRGFMNTTCGGLHAALIVGSRPQGGKCQYLLRNNIGTSCNAYRYWSCETDSGQIWVDEDHLLDNTTQAYHLE